MTIAICRRVARRCRPVVGDEEFCRRQALRRCRQDWRRRIATSQVQKTPSPRGHGNRAKRITSLFAGMPSSSTTRRSSSRPPARSLFCGPRCSKRSRCDIVGSIECRAAYPNSMRLPSSGSEVGTRLLGASLAVAHNGQAGSNVPAHVQPTFHRLSLTDTRRSSTAHEHP